MDITYRKATPKDIDTLIKLRLDYLTTDRGNLSREETEAIVTQLKDYFPRQLNNSFIAFFAEHNGETDINSVYGSFGNTGKSIFHNRQDCNDIECFYLPRLSPQGDSNEITYYDD